MFLNGMIYGLSEAISILFSGAIFLFAGELTVMKLSFLAFFVIQPMFLVFTSDAALGVIQFLKVIMVGMIYNGSYIV